MLTQHRYVLVALVLSFSFFTGCTSTNVTGSWTKSDYAGQPFTSILVIGYTEDPTNRLFWENVMSDKLKGNVTTVVKSLSASSDDRKIDKDELLEYVNRNGIEAVLVTRLVDTKQEKVYRPASTNTGTAYYGHYNSYFTHAQTQMSKPGYMTTQSVVLLETNLYEVKNKELVWSMSSDTVESNSVQQLMKSVSKSVLATLKKDKLI